MTLLLPLGLIGLLGVAALIVIYVIRPNYETRHISSSYIWKLSLKYRKKRLPTNRLRNILLFLAQLLILLLMAAILARPALALNTSSDRTDVIAIIDSSASMSAGYNEDTRFRRALDEVKDLSQKTLRGGGYMTIILAEEKARFIERTAPGAKLLDIYEELDELAEGDGCSYGVADIAGAISLCEEVLAENSSASICLYTDTEYDYVPEGITVYQMDEAGEWNAAVLDAYTEMEDGYYRLTVEMACYGGMDRSIPLHVSIEGKNAHDATEEGSNATFDLSVPCNDDRTKKVIFCTGGADTEAADEDTMYIDLSNEERFFSYRSINVYIDADDSLPADNSLQIYGGLKEVLKVEYASGDPNIFFNGALLTLKNLYGENWDIQITSVKKGEPPKLEGFDFYIFEHTMPESLPADGVVFLMDPDIAPVNAGFSVLEDTGLMGGSVSLTGGESHPLLRNILADRITVSRYKKLALEPEFGYEVIMTCDGSPLFAAVREESRQILVMPFSVHFSNISVMPEFILLFMNIFDEYFPATVNKTSFEVNEEILLSGRGESISLSRGGNEADEVFTEYPATAARSTPGTYSIRQTTYYGKELSPIDIFVRIPRYESNIRRVEATLEGPVRDGSDALRYRELFIYLAAALVALLFAEWMLQARENR